MADRPDGGARPRTQEGIGRKAETTWVSEGRTGSQAAAQELLEEQTPAQETWALTRGDDLTCKKVGSVAPCRGRSAMACSATKGRKNRPTASRAAQVEQRRDVPGGSLRGKDEGAARPPGGEELLAGDVEAEDANWKLVARGSERLPQLPREQEAQRDAEEGRPWACRWEPEV